MKAQRTSLELPPPHTLPLTQAVMALVVPSDRLNETPSMKKKRLEGLLISRSGALDATIFPEDQRFQFIWADRKSSVQPWAIIESVPRLVPSTDGSFPPTHWSEQTLALRRALDEVWTRQMLCPFNKAVVSGAIKLQGRIDVVSNPFSDIPADVWQSASVADWVNGHVDLADGTRFWFVRVTQTRQSEKHGRPSKFDQDQVNAAVIRILKERGRPTRSGDPGWQCLADLERHIAEFCEKVFGDEPAKSTCQRLARAALEAAALRGF